MRRWLGDASERRMSGDVGDSWSPSSYSRCCGDRRSYSADDGESMLSTREKGDGEGDGSSASMSPPIKVGKGKVGKALRGCREFAADCPSSAVEGRQPLPSRADRDDGSREVPFGDSRPRRMIADEVAKATGHGPAIAWCPRIESSILMRGRNFTGNRGVVRPKSP